jgi:hypothetical protein
MITLMFELSFQVMQIVIKSLNILEMVLELVDQYDWRWFLPLLTKVSK